MEIHKKTLVAAEDGSFYETIEFITIDEEYLKQIFRDKDLLAICYSGFSVKVESHESLPTPPDGYKWELDSGGIRIVPCNYKFYRLWNTKELGLMRRSE